LKKQKGKAKSNGMENKKQSFFGFVYKFCLQTSVDRKVNQSVYEKISKYKDLRTCKQCKRNIFKRVFVNKTCKQTGKQSG